MGCTTCEETGRDLKEMQAAVIARMNLANKPPCPCEQHVGNFGKARVMADGSIVYSQKGHEPPPEIEGFRRDPGNAWRFIKLWKPCIHRIQAQKVKPCGAIGLLTICNNEALPCRGSEVTFAECQVCPYQ